MGTVWNRYGEAIGTTSGKSYTDNSSAATNTHGGGAQASKTWTGGSSSSTSTSSSTGSSSSSSSNSKSSSSSSSSKSSGSSGSSSSGSKSSSASSSSGSSSSQSTAAWWQANFGYVPSWVGGSSSALSTPSTPPTPSTPAKPATPATPSTPSSSGGSKASSSPLSASYSNSILDQIKAGNTSLGWSEIAKAGQDYNSSANDPTRQAAAHDWANKVRDALGVSSQYDSATGAYTGGGADPNPYSSGGSNKSSAPVLGAQTNTPTSLVPNSPQFQQGSYSFDSNAGKIPVNLGNGQVINGVMKDGYTYVPIKQMANMMGGQLGNYDPNNLTIQVNGKTVPVHIDANGVGYTPIRNMADAFGTNVGWNNKSDGSGVSDVYLTQPAAAATNEPHPVIDEELLQQQQLDMRQQMLEELLKQFQQPIPMPEIPNMPEMPQQAAPSYEDFLEKAREMINPAYAKARETLSKVNEQQRQLMMQRLAQKGQPFGGLRDEMEMQLSQDFMSQLSDQDMQQIQEAIQVAQSLSDKDEEQAKWLADQAWQRWQAQANLAQQQYQNAVSQKSNQLSGLMNLMNYLQNEDQANQQAALNQQKFDWQKQVDLLPYQAMTKNQEAQLSWDMDKFNNVSAADAARLQAQYDIANMNNNTRLAEISASNQRAAASAKSVPEWQANLPYQSIANDLASELPKYASYEDMLASVNSAAGYLPPQTVDALRKIAASTEPYYYSYAKNDLGDYVKTPKSGASFAPGQLDPLRVKWNSKYAPSFGSVIPGEMPNFGN